MPNSAIPIRPIVRTELDLYGLHLKGLTKEDRILRFCNAISDDGINSLVARIEKRWGDNGDDVLVHMAPGGKIIGAVHVAIGRDRDEIRFAEVGISVLPEGRGKGIARSLMERAVLHARNARCERLQTMCLVTNAAIEHLSQSMGMTTKRTLGEDEAHAEIQLAVPDFHSITLEALLNQIGTWDEVVQSGSDHHLRFIGTYFERMGLPIS